MSFLGLIKPYFKKITAVLLLIVMANLTALVMPWGVKMILDDALASQDIKLLSRVIFLLVVVLILHSILNFCRKVMANLIGERVICDLREGLFWKAHRIPLNCVKDITPSQILTRLTGDVEGVRRFIFGDIIDLAYAILRIGLVIAALLYINSKLTLTALCILPLFLFVYLRFLPTIKEGYTQLKEINGQMLARMHETVNGLSVIRTLTLEAHEQRQFSLRQGKIIRLANNIHRNNTALWVIIEVFTSLATIGILWLGGLEVIQGRMTPGELIAFYSYLGMLFTPMIRLAVINTSYQEAAAALRRINDVMTLPVDTPESSSPIIPQSVKEIVFHGVSYRYTSNKPAVTDIEFTIRKGETVGLIGPSGTGKTTIVHLLLRFFDPNNGNILINGEPLTNLALKAYYQHLSVVLQDDYLFSGTIEENIRYGKFECSPNEIYGAAEDSGAHQFIKGLPDGYKTRIGERGFKLSSGQRQRIAIARALIRNPSLLILDEATSAVDAFTENKIQKSIRTRLPDSTLLIVAHRFSSIAETDKTIVIEEGQISEIGGHNDLLKKSDFYSNLYNEQFKENSDERELSPQS